MTRKNQLDVAVVCPVEVLRIGIVAIVERDMDLRVQGAYAQLDELTDALEHGRAAPPDVVIVELAPPWEGLWSAIERWRARYPNVGLLVLGVLNAHLVECALEAGAHGVLDLGDGPDTVHRALHAAGRGGLADSVWMRGHLRNGRGQKRPRNKDVPQLTPQQAIVLRLMARRESPTYALIAEEMGIGLRTVHTHRDELFRKFKVKKRGALLHRARELRLI